MDLPHELVRSTSDHRAGNAATHRLPDLSSPPITRLTRKENRLSCLLSTEFCRRELSSIRKTIAGIKQRRRLTVRWSGIDCFNPRVDGLVCDLRIFGPVRNQASERIAFEVYPPVSSHSRRFPFQAQPHLTRIQKYCSNLKPLNLGAEEDQWTPKRQISIQLRQRRIRHKRTNRLRLAIQRTESRRTLHT